MHAPLRPRRRLSLASTALALLAMPLGAQPPRPLFGYARDMTPAGFPADHAGTQDMAMGDIDRDGDLDLVVSFSAGSVAKLAYYENRGGGVFVDASQGIIPNTGRRYRALELVDLDGDGDKDLLAIADTVLSYYNNGSPFGGLSEQNADATGLKLTFAAWSIHAFDADKAGRPEIFVGAVNNTSGFFVYDSTRGKWSNEASTRLHPPITANIDLAKSADLDGDGFEDLVLLYGNRSGAFGTLHLYRNDKANPGNFRDVPGWIQPVPQYTLWAFALGDVDGDGDVDLLSHGDKDLVYLFKNDGTGVMSPSMTVPTIPGRADALALADVDNDRDLDALILHWRKTCDTTIRSAEEQSNQLWLNDGRGNFTDTTRAKSFPIDYDYSRALAVEDVDADKDVDVIIGNLTTPTRLYLNDGSGKFVDTTSPLPSHNDYCPAIATADVDRDGFQDMVLLSYVNNPADACPPRLLLNSDGNGTFDNDARKIVTLPTESLAVGKCAAFGDLNQDGFPDLAIGTTVGKRIQLYVNNAGSLQGPVLTALPDHTDEQNTLLWFDADRDLHPDLVVGTQVGLKLYLNQSRGTNPIRFGDATNSLPLITNAVRSLAAIDVDKDGMKDLLFVGVQNKLWALERDSTTGLFKEVTLKYIGSQSSTYWDMQTGDVNGDGFEDFVAAANAECLVAVGAGKDKAFAVSKVPEWALSVQAMALGDVNDDGFPDLVSGTNAAGGGELGTRIHLNDKVGQFARVTGRHPVDSPLISTNDLTLVDLDGDGDLDWVEATGSFTGNADRAQSRILFNLTRQMSAASVARVGKSVGFELASTVLPDQGSYYQIILSTERGGGVRLPGLGTFHLRPDRVLIWPGLGPMTNGSGDFAIPSLPALPVDRLYWQALLFSPSQLNKTSLTNLEFTRLTLY